MKVLVTGATGFLGRSICADLAARGHEVAASTRGRPPQQGHPAASWVVTDFVAAGAAGWHPHLSGVEAVVNCVGVLQDGPRDDTAGAHSRGAAALFAACAMAGVARVIHFSAIGVDRHQASSFSASKLEGDRALMALDLDWVILRPSVVLGAPVFGAGALMRGLAALSWLPVMPQTGPLQVVALEDVVDTVAFFLTPGAPSRVAIELAGPERLSMAEVVARFRAWFGWRPARIVTLPRRTATLLYRLGDLAGALGWRPPLRSTAQREIAHGAVGDPAEWTRLTGIAPRSLGDALALRPATVQERWFARLYLLKPVLFVILPAFWLLTGIISLTTGWENGLALMHRAGAGPLAAPGVIAGAIADMVVGAAIACRPTARYGLRGALGMSAFYILAGTILLPELWKEPLGPLLKIWPIVAAHLAALVILDER